MTQTDRDINDSRILFLNLFFPRRFQVYLSHNLPEQLDMKMLSNVKQRPGVESIRGNVFTFLDGSTAEVDDFIFCTGNINSVISISRWDLTFTVHK